MYEQAKMPLLRFYLATTLKQKNSEEFSGPSDSSTQQDDIDVPVTAESVISTLERLNQSSEGDILSHAMDVAGIPAADDDNDSLPDLFSVTNTLPDLFSVSNETPVSQTIKEVPLKVHRGHLLHEFIKAFKEIDPNRDIVSIQMVMPDGNLEAAEDGGGVTRDSLAEFWHSFYEQCTIGTKFKIPILRHDFAEEEWRSVANIIVFGFKACGYFPIQLSQPFLELCLDGKPRASIIDAFFEIIPEDEAATLKKALSDYDLVDHDELLDILQIHDTKSLPTRQNIDKILNEIAHKEIIQTPMFIVDCFHPVLKHLDITDDQLNHMYSDLIPTPKSVNQLLKFPDVMCADEQTVANHLKRLIRELNVETLGKFVRFCTGSDLMINKEVKVAFVNVSGLARRPVAHTCSCLLELSKSYESFPQFRSEFMAVLRSNIWVMDII
jgi:hypothetical protein